MSRNKARRFLKYDSEAFCLPEDERIRISKQDYDENYIDEFEGIGNLYEMLFSSVTKFGGRPFLGYHLQPTEPFAWLSYKEVFVKIIAAGSAFKSMLSNEHRNAKCIGLYGTNCPQWLIAEYACWSYGIVAVPLYDTLGDEALDHICNEVELSLIVCDSPARAQKLIKRHERIQNLSRIVIIFPDGNLESLAHETSTAGIKIFTFTQILELGIENPREPCPVGPEDRILICYTSGTTGLPKGVEINSKSVLAKLRGMIKSNPNIKDNNIVHLSFLPMAHIYEQMVEILILVSGARVAFSRAGVKSLMPEMMILRPTLFTAVPVLLCRLYAAMHSCVNGHGKWEGGVLEHAIKAQLRLADRQIYFEGTLWDKLVFSRIRDLFGGNVKMIISGGAPIAPAILRFTRALFPCPVVEFYGSTEACGALTMCVAGDLGGGHVGAPLPSTQVKLVDVPGMNLIAELHNKGEICWKDVGSSSGYYKNPKATNALIDENGWMHTGDVGIWVNNSLKIVDRCKNMFKLSQGEYVAPEKVEMIYQESAYISQVFVDGNALSSFPVAIVIPEPTHLAVALRREYNTPDAQWSWPNLCTDPASERLIMTDINELGRKAKLKGFEKVKCIFVSSQPFTIENNLLTPTMKLSRHPIRERYAKQLEELQNRV